MSRTFAGFPRSVVGIIAQYAATYQIAAWVKALDFPKNSINKYLSKNPLAMDVLPMTDICWGVLCENLADWAVDLIMQHRDRISWYHLAHNPNPRAFALVEEYIASKSDHELCKGEIHEMLSSNPCGIELLRKRPALLHPMYLLWNPAAKLLIEEMKIPIEHCALAMNPSEWAADLLLVRSLKSVDDFLPIMVCANRNARITAYVLAHPDIIDWRGLSKNPTAIDYLRANPDKITSSIYANPAIFEPFTPDYLITCLMEL